MRLLIALGAVALVGATTASGLDRTGRTAEVPIIVTRGGSLPRTCAGPRGVALVVVRCTQAFNRGDSRRLNRIFDDYLQRYWVSEESSDG